MDRSYLEPDLNTTRHSRYSDKSVSSNNKPNDYLIKKSTQFSKAQLRDLCEPVFPQSQPNTIVECLKLKTWNTISPRDQILDPLQHEQIHLKSPFLLNYKINCKLALFVGDITNLGNWFFFKFIYFVFY